MLILAVASIWIDPWDHRLPISKSSYCGVWGRGWDVRLVFFNDAEYGPYRGSIISLNGYPPLEEERGYGDRAGIYYRYFRWSDATLWTLMLSIWYPAALFAILPAWQLSCWLRMKDSPASRQPVQLTGDARGGE